MDLMYNVSTEQSWSNQPLTAVTSVSGWAAWQYVVTILLGVIVYDQGNTPQVPQVSEHV